MLTKLLLFLLFQSSTAVIYRLNDSEYALMPPKFHLDNYEECFDDPEGLYCFGEFALVSDEPSPLLTMIQEFSSHASTHYNHTLISHGRCIKQTCKKFYEISKRDLRSSLEACVNESLYDKYQLKARLSDGFNCSKRDKSQPIDYVDIAVGVICVVILLANLIGSLCNFYIEKGRDHGGFRFLYCFSIFRNWKGLVASPTEGLEPRLQALNGLHGIRALNIYIVISCHSFMSIAILIVNPEYVENMYTNKLYYIPLNATLTMQTYLGISSFLLVYNWLINTEKHEPSWKTLPTHILTRWLRLTPSYAVILGLTATWFGRIASGPYWKNIIFDELTACRREWWKNLLYINNYYDGAECMPQTWYLAADTQLYCVASIVLLICQSVRTRKVVLSLLFVVGLVVPALHTYYQHLNGIVIISPESAVTLFLNNPTFNHVYKRGHTNLIGYVIGMAMGYMIYDWQKARGDPKSFWKYRYLYWSLLPLIGLCCFCGGFFYQELPPLPTYVQLLFAALFKPTFAILIGTIILGVIIQFEGIYRKILEWRAWTLPSRLSYSAYLTHIALIRNHVAMLTSTQRTSIYNILLQSHYTVLVSFICAFFLWILVEAPFGNLVRTYYSKTKTPPKEDSKEEVKF